MNLALDQKKAVCKLLLDMMSVDGNIAIGEFTYLRDVRSQLDISDSDLKSTKNLSVLASLSLLSEFENSEKEIIVDLLTKMLKADGQIHKKEIKLLKLVCNILNTPMPKI